MLASPKEQLEQIILRLRPQWPWHAWPAIDAHMGDSEVGTAVSLLYEEGKEHGFHGQRDHIVSVAEQLGETLTD